MVSVTVMIKHSRVYICMLFSSHSEWVMGVPGSGEYRGQIHIFRYSVSNGQFSAPLITITGTKVDFIVDFHIVEYKNTSY